MRYSTPYFLERGSCHLRTASNHTRYVLAAPVRLASSDFHVRPRPVGARSTATDNNDIVPRASDSTGSGNILDDEARDGNASGWVSVEVATVVVLLNQDSISALNVSIET